MTEKSTVENRKTVQEISGQIANLKESIERKKEQLEQYRSKRAAITVNEESTAKNKQKIANIDHEIKNLQRAIENAPAELTLLEENLVAAQARIAQEERAKLIEHQQEVANEIELLSKGFVATLQKAVSINEQLKNALLAEVGLKEKTGVEILKNYCDGSMESLQKLTETMEYQITNGNHTILVGGGIVQSATPLRL